MRRSLHLVEREALRVLAVTVTPGPGAKRHVEQALGPAFVVVLAHGWAVETLRRDEDVEIAVVDRRDVHILHRLAGAEATETDQDLPFGRSRRLGREDRWRVFCAAADREAPDEIVVMSLLERGMSGEDDVGVAGRLVHPVVETDHAVEAVQRIVQTVTTGVDRTGLPATVMSARIWPFPGVAISSAKHDAGT